MPTLQSQISIAAAATNDNVLTGSSFLYMPFDGVVRFGLTGDANAADLTLDVTTGSDVIAETFEPAPTTTFPKDPEDFALTDIVGSGELIRIRARNKHATVARVLFYTLKFLPI